AATDLGAIHAIALHRAVARGQCAVVRGRLAFATPARARLPVGIIVAQQAQLQHQCRYDGSIEFFPSTTAQIAGQDHFTETRAYQAADRNACRFEHAANFAVAPLFERNPIPTIATLAAKIFEHAELRNAVFKLDSLEQTGLLLFAELAQDPDRIFAFCAVARMREAICEVARCSKYEQTFSIQVQPPYGQPLSYAHLG